MVMEMGAFSISLAHTGRIPHREAARGNTPIPSKRLPSLMSGMARGAVSLHGKHPFQCGRRNAQPPGNRNIVFYILIHSAAADDQGVGAPQHIPAHINPGLVFLGNAVTFRLVSALVIFLGAGMEMSLLWDLSDVLMGVMALINIPVILILSGIAFKAIQDYEAQLKQGINPVFKSADIGLRQKTDFWR